jgi:hypothetical protein
LKSLALKRSEKLVVPVKAGIRIRLRFKFNNRLDSAGMTEIRADFQWKKVGTVRHCFVRRSTEEQFPPVD